MLLNVHFNKNLLIYSLITFYQISVADCGDKEESVDIWLFQSVCVEDNPFAALSASTEA